MQVHIENPPQLRGDYPIDLDFSYGECHLIKKVAGLRGLEIDDGIENGDTDLFLALGVIGAMRAGKLREDDAMEAVAELMKTKIGDVRLIPDEGDEDEDAEGKAPAPSGLDETPSSSGEITTQPSDVPQETLRLATGGQT